MGGKAKDLMSGEKRGFVISQNKLDERNPRIEKEIVLGGGGKEGLLLHHPPHWFANMKGKKGEPMGGRQ